MSKRFPGRRLSVVRLAVLCLGLAVIVAGGVVGWGRFEDARAATSGAKPWFSGYVDATATPFYAFESPVTAEGKSVVLSFIVANAKNSCQPSWGGAYTFGEAETTMDLDRRIARLIQSGGDISISFGGLVNQELATVCMDPAKLKDAYKQVVDRYNLPMIDLDVEGNNLSDKAAGQRRAEAVASLQRERRAEGKELTVWLTLPVAPTGLTGEGTTAVGQMLAAGVDLAGVNIMTMDYGASRGPAQSMLDASTAAADATHAQLIQLYKQAGSNLGPQTLWRKIGLTPMIGQNDVKGEVFGLDAAAGLNAYARERGIGRVSMWSLNRDMTCSANYADVTRVSDSCSGIAQGASRFAQVLGQSTAALPETSNPAPTAVPTVATTHEADDPATSPYPIWTSDASYVADDRIVWHGNVFAAKWWTRGDLPDNPVLQGADTPWKLIGPVLPGDKPMPVVTVPAGTYPEWASGKVYEKGDRILFSGRILEAKWWTQGDSPQAALQGSSSSPWIMLKADEVEKILAAKAGKQ